MSSMGTRIVINIDKEVVTIEVTTTGKLLGSVSEKEEKAARFRALLEKVIDSGMNQLEVAEALQVTPQYISYLKHEKRDVSDQILTALQDLHEQRCQ